MVNTILLLLQILSPGPIFPNLLRVRLGPLKVLTFVVAVFPGWCPSCWTSGKISLKSARCGQNHQQHLITVACRWILIYSYIIKQYRGWCSIEIVILSYRIYLYYCVVRSKVCEKKCAIVEMLCSKKTRKLNRVEIWKRNWWLLHGITWYVVSVVLIVINWQIHIMTRSVFSTSTFVLWNEVSLPLPHYKCCLRASLAGWHGSTSENNCVKTNKYRHILSAVHISSKD